MICSKPGCGTVVDGKKFCPACGTKVEPVETADEKTDAEIPAVQQEIHEEVKSEPIPQPVPQPIPQPAPQPIPQPAPQPRPAPQANQTQYAQTPPAPVAPGKDSPYAPVSVGQWFGILLLLAIPFVNIIMIIVWACSAKRKSLGNFAKAQLIWMLIAVILLILTSIVVAIAGAALFGSIVDQFGSIEEWIKSIIDSFTV